MKTNKIIILKIYPAQKVLEVGRLQTSPNPKIFLYFLCYNVSGSTSSKLFDYLFAKPASTKF